MLCESCGTVFEPKRRTSRFCSNPCKFRSRKKKCDCVCAHCGNTYQVAPHALIYSKHCSRKCKGEASRRVVTPDVIRMEWLRNVDVRAPDECWEWKGTTLRFGYGRLAIGRRYVDSSHRISYRLHFGEIPSGMQVCHTCDNRKCANPHHLFLGTISDNQSDKVKKGRQSRGSQMATAKLTDEAVTTIRSSSLTNKELALKFGVDPSIISEVRAGKRWRHVT